jgi:putative Ca2+/H+ antiporter (TMEM165/GDT1 family)
MPNSVLLIAFATVFAVELIGDKTLYTISALAARHRLSAIFAGTTVAFMLKMAVAVLLGKMISELPVPLVASISALTFLILALFIFLKKAPGDLPEPPPRASRTILIAFAAIFFTEWGDMGQITAGALAAQTGQPAWVWLGATLAMMTKGVLAMTVGMGIRKRVPFPVLRYGAAGLCLVLAMVSACEVFGILPM